jgi:hypothetical protein
VIRGGDHAPREASGEITRVHWGKRSRRISRAHAGEESERARHLTPVDDWSANVFSCRDREKSNVSSTSKVVARH